LARGVLRKLGEGLWSFSNDRLLAFRANHASYGHREILQRNGNCIEEFPNLDKWLTPDALLGLSVVLEFAERETNEYLREALLVALSSKMRSIGNVDVDVVRAEYRKTPRRNVDVLKLVLRQLVSMDDSIQCALDSHGGLVAPVESAVVVESDVRDLDMAENSVTHVITSPPYGVEAVSYLRTHLLSYRCLKRFLETDPYSFGDRVIGSEYVRQRAWQLGMPLGMMGPTFESFFASLEPKPHLTARATMMMGFFCDMAQVVTRLSRWVRSGGFVCLVIGNNRIGAATVPANRILTETFASNDFVLQEEIEHKLKSNNSNSRVPWQDRIIQDESILVFRRR
jgi:hypothetical protein